ncbi:MAG TPA: hypothetical protein VKQ36_07950, partial [Ktedonobacterales bacterium]|nr:hypothetical protein [Ktedonobacterales bacterium]
QHTDAADLLIAINELGQQKNARKEAKRSLIQLQSQRIYPNWKPPAEFRRNLPLIPEPVLEAPVNGQLF